MLSLLIHQCRNGFDTTNFSFGLSQGLPLEDDKLTNCSSLTQKDKIFEVTARTFNHHTSSYEDQASFKMIFSSELNGLCVILNDKIKYSDLTREIMQNFFFFASKTNQTKICFLLNRKNKDYVKLLQGIMTVGFKTSNSRFNLDKVEYKVMNMDVSKKSDEVQEIDF